MERHPHPVHRGHVVTVDDAGDVRSGPPGAWWPNLMPRPRGASGLTIEIPSGRAAAWNVAFLAAEAAGAVWAHTEGMSWQALGTGAVVVLAAAAVFILLGLPALGRRGDRRHERELERWRRESAAVDARVAARWRERYGEEMHAPPTSGPEPEPEPLPALADAVRQAQVPA